MISVCIATYNGERFIKAQLDSILCQLSDGDEVIISDDSSTDRTIDIIKSYGSDTIVLLENQTFKSPTFNFENALKHAKNEYIFLSDQDDLWEENKVKVMLGYLQAYDLVMSDALLIDAEGKEIDSSFYTLNSSSNGLFSNLVKNSYIGCTMAFNRKILDIALPFPKNTPMHDWWIGLTAELFGNVYFCKEPLTQYRRHDANASASAEKSPYSFTEKLRMRSRLIANLAQRWFGR
ncbi:MAG: glycosyltransferase family 2 protein [Sulfurimonadaceae bacterium]